jgi:hypothetical protein
MSLTEFVIWLSSGVGNAVIASSILENLQWYQDLEAQNKKNVFISFSVVLALAGYAFLVYVPKETIEALTPWFGLIYATVAAQVGGTAYHMLTKK